MYDTLQVFLLFLYTTRNKGNVTNLNINYLLPIFSKPVQNSRPWFYLTIYCHQIDFIFYIDVTLNLLKRLQCFVDKTRSYLDNIYLEVVAQSSSLKNFEKFGKYLCWSLVFNKVAAWEPPALLKRDPDTGVVL